MATSEATGREPSPGVGNEPEGESLKGIHRGWFRGVIPTHSLLRTSKFKTIEDTRLKTHFILDSSTWRALKFCSPLHVNVGSRCFL